MREKNALGRLNPKKNQKIAIIGSTIRTPKLPFSLDFNFVNQLILKYLRHQAQGITVTLKKYQWID
jgi:hypothetical protein